MGELRIIAGEGRGRKIRTFSSDLSVRPILARIKKSLFDILTVKLPGSSFLDLYAGTGAVGIEALSRGAGKAVFVDSEQRCVELIQENLNMLGWASRASVIRSDALRVLKNIGSRFDVIFMGPPYKDLNKTPLFLTALTLKAVSESELLNNEGWVISQHHFKEPVAIPANMIKFRSNKYGDTLVDFYKKDTVNAKEDS